MKNKQIQSALRVLTALFMLFCAKSACSQETSGVSVKNITAGALKTEERDPFKVSKKILMTEKSKYISFSGEGVDAFNLPTIEITGIMVLNTKVMATAKIQGLGEMVLKPNDKIVMPDTGKHGKRFKSFIIKEITPDKLIILVEGGFVVQGRFR